MLSGQRPRRFICNAGGKPAFSRASNGRPLWRSIHVNQCAVSDRLVHRMLRWERGCPERRQKCGSARLKAPRPRASRRGHLLARARSWANVRFPEAATPQWHTVAEVPYFRRTASVIETSRSERPASTTGMGPKLRFAPCGSCRPRTMPPCSSAATHAEVIATSARSSSKVDRPFVKKRAKVGFRRPLSFGREIRTTATVFLRRSPQKSGVTRAGKASPSCRARLISSV